MSYCSKCMAESDPMGCAISNCPAGENYEITKQLNAMPPAKFKGGEAYIPKRSLREKRRFWEKDAWWSEKFK